MARKKTEDKLITTTTKDNILLENNFDTEKMKGDLEKYVDEKINKVFVDELDVAFFNVISLSI